MWQRGLLLWLLLASAAAGAQPQHSLTLGVLADLPESQMLARYTPLADYLNRSLPGVQISILPLSYADNGVERVLARNQVDLLLTNPGDFVRLRAENSFGGALVTQERVANGHVLSVFGGVMFTRAGRDDIVQLADLADQRIGAVDERSLGGYQAQLYQLQQAGVALRSPPSFLRRHPEVVEAVVDGRVDVGFVRSGVLEAMVEAGRLQPGQVKVIHRQPQLNFPFAVSTRLYPEWPLLAMPHVDERVLRRIVAALLALQPDTRFRQATRIGGFATAANYLGVEKLRRALALPPFDRPAGFSWREAWRDNRGVLLALLGSLMLVVMAVASLLYRQNQRLRRITRHLAESEQRFRSFFEQNSSVMLLIDPAGGIIEDANQAAVGFYGYPREQLRGMPLQQITSLGPQEPAGQGVRAFNGGQKHFRLAHRLADGTVRQVEVHATPIRSRQRELLFSIVHDITQQVEQQRHLEHYAHYDALTNLPNRVLMSDHLQLAMQQARRHGSELVLAYIDLDGFKAVNDNHGHDIGDRMLVAVAARVRQMLREVDTLARLGGDEFAAVLVDMESDHGHVPVLRRILEAASAPVRIGELELSVSASIGVTLYPQESEIDADQLLRQADQAMYQAKLEGKNRFHLFDARQDRLLRGVHETLEAIQVGLREDQFELYYQPIVNLRSGELLAAEALIRWRHPRKGLLLPEDFLPVVEGSALSIELGEWVVEQALTQMARWQEHGLEVACHINIGVHHLQTADFLSRLERLLARHPAVAPSRIKLEVLETVALEDVEHVTSLILAAEKLGIQFALDDFGTGYSSLSYLRRLPVQALKIDRSFVRGMTEDQADRVMLEGILGLARLFRREVVAEGVETVRAGELLTRMGCEVAQGYGIARPMPADQLPQWFREWQPDPSWRA